jgi:biotin carboxylase
MTLDDFRASVNRARSGPVWTYQGPSDVAVIWALDDGKFYFLERHARVSKLVACATLDEAEERLFKHLEAAQ